MENHTSKTYSQRMNQTAASKFDVIKPYLEQGQKLLDFGSGVTPDFIKNIEEQGVAYYAYDISPSVNAQLEDLGVKHLTNLSDDWTDAFDIVYLSSVFHELMSYLSRSARMATLKDIHRVLKPGGLLIIRDWSCPEDHLTDALQATSEKATRIIDTWVNALTTNGILNKPVVKQTNLHSGDHYYVGHPKDLYELMFHVVWGLPSLEREARETYHIDRKLIDKWLVTPFGYDLQHYHEETDVSYLQHLWDYFDIDYLKWPTKSIYVLKKPK